MGVVTLPYDPAEDLTDRAAQEELLEEAFASGELNFIVAAISSVARARGMSPLIETMSSTSGEARAFEELRLSAILAAVSALGYKLALTPV